MDLRCQTGDETTQEEGWRQSDDTIRQVLQLKEVIIYCCALSEFEKGVGGIVVSGQYEACLKSLKKVWLGGELTVIGHPLEPSQGAALHVK